MLRMPIGIVEWEARAGLLREMLRSNREQGRKLESLYWEAAKEAMDNGSITYKLLVLSREAGLYEKWAHACGMTCEPVEEVRDDTQTSGSSEPTDRDVPEGVSGVQDSRERNLSAYEDPWDDLRDLHEGLEEQG
jgi:hypothetical protein